MLTTLKLVMYVEDWTKDEGSSIALFKKRWKLPTRLKTATTVAKYRLTRLGSMKW